MITTVCMNPSFDKTARVERHVIGDVNRLSDVRVDIGGKGVNVAVVLARLGIPVQCVGCVGETNSEAFLKMVRKENLVFHSFSVPGEVRTNLKLMDLDTKMITEYNEPGIQMDEEKLNRFLQMLSQSASDSEYVVLSGSLPAGCCENTYQRCMQALREKKCVLDTAGASLLHGIKEKPFLIKPNLPEIEFLMKKELRTLRSLRDAALFLIGYGAQNVVISMGKYGAMFVNSQTTLFAPALMVETRSTVGAGDAMVGGIVAGLSRNSSVMEAFRFGVAAGAASVMTEGTQLLQKADFESLLPKVMVQEV